MKRRIAILLTICMIVTMIPGMAFAETADKATPADYVPNAATEQAVEDVRAEAAAFAAAADLDVDAKMDVKVEGESKNLERPEVDKEYAEDYSKVKKAVAGQKDVSADYVCQLGNYIYTSLQYAVNDAIDGDTIYLIDNVSMQGAIIAGKDINIDLNGYYIGGAYTDMMLAVSDADVDIYNSDSDYASSIMNVGSGNGLVVLGDSDVTVENIGFVTSADESCSIMVGAGADVDVYECTFLNGAILDDYSSEVIGVFASEDAYVTVEDSMVVFDEGVAALIGEDGLFDSFGANFFWVEDGMCIFNSGGIVDVDGGHYLAYNPYVNYSGKTTLWYGLFESESYGVSAIDSGLGNNGAGITIATDSNVRPLNWRTVDRDIIGVYYNLAKPANTKVNLNAGFKQIKATWNAVPGADTYAVYYKKGTGSYKFWGRTTNKYANIKNLTGGCKYTVKIVPCDKLIGEYDDIFGESAKFSTAFTYTLKKVNLNSFQKSNGKVKVRWYNINGETGYQISKSTSSTGTSIVATVANASATSKLISATKGKNYYYKVRAYKTVNGKKIFGPWSTAKKFKR